MRKSNLILIGLCLTLMTGEAYAQSSGSRGKSGRVIRPGAGGKQNVKRPNTGTARPSRPARPATGRSGVTPANQLTQALQLVRAGQHLQAAPQLYSLSRRPEFTSERMQIKYILGVSLMELKLYQIAAFQFVDVVRRGDSKYVRQALEKLSIVADQLGDDTLLNYAISKVRVDEFPPNQKDIVYYRLGEIRQKNRNPTEAEQLFGRVTQNSRYYQAAQYRRGTALLEGNRPKEAIPIFEDILNSRAGAPVTDLTKVQAQIALARSYYQMQDWDRALEYYRDIPRDTEIWHDSLFESTWASLRAAKFRTTLSALQSLHSAFYEDYFIPESLLVRGIVYLYICKFDETDKTLNLFEKTYQPVLTSIDRYLQSVKDPIHYFNEIERAYTIRRDRKPIMGLKVPYMVSRRILDEGDVKRSFQYMRSLNDERLKLESYGGFARSPLGVYSLKVLSNRFKNTKIAVGEMVRAHLVNIRSDMRDFFEQASFIRYETINGKKEILKKKIAGKENEAVDDNIDRDFYIQNGFEYWPFQGEYWIDEIGNYHYLGKQNCE
ncbi:MAG: tetratricopeptide repeat protein [Bdellovibrionaceae bacterium]|nr:tetratricopeptide repeat protein [Pseudobdellovibrionaceae bacterium]